MCIFSIPNVVFWLLKYSWIIFCRCHSSTPTCENNVYVKFWIMPCQHWQFTPCKSFWENDVTQLMMVSMLSKFCLWVHHKPCGKLFWNFWPPPPFVGGGKGQILLLVKWGHISLCTLHWARSLSYLVPHIASRFWF